VWHGIRYMHSDRERAALLDIRDNIMLAENFTKDQTFESFRGDLMRLYAATRCLEIISEASRRLSQTLKERHPGISWGQMAGAGNIYRHDYEQVAAHRVWDTVRNALPLLRAVVEQELG
jgi:uncharacterized protein with HEPN domain